MMGMGGSKAEKAQPHIHRDWVFGHVTFFLQLMFFKFGNKCILLKMGMLQLRSRAQMAHNGYQ
jgi:hypothetical protein